MADFWFIRHFRTPWNAEGRLQGQRDIALTDPLGPEDQAALAANRQELHGQDFSLVLTSPLGRARQTAALHGFDTAQIDTDLAEIAFGDWESRTWHELEAAHPGAWSQSPQNLPLGESFTDFTDRIMRVRDRARSVQGPVLAFGHGAWLGALRSVLDGHEGRGMARYPLQNGGLVRLKL